MWKTCLIAAFLGFTSNLLAQSLIIHLPEPKNTKGNFMVGIYTEGDDFPKEPSIPRKVEITSLSKRTITIDDLQEGTYAVSVYHDLNNNAELDRNLIGIPKEPFAFSNMSSMSMGPPKFEDASFKLENSSKEITLTWLNE